MRKARRSVAARRGARDMFTVTVHDHRVDDPAARLMVIIGERGGPAWRSRAAVDGVVK